MEGFADDFEQFDGVEGFSEEGAVEGFFGEFFGEEAAHEDDFEGGVLDGEQFGEGFAVAFGHDDVGEEEVDFAIARAPFFLGFASISGGEDLEIFGAEVSGKELANSGLIVNDENDFFVVSGRGVEGFGWAHG